MKQGMSWFVSPDFIRAIKSQGRGVEIGTAWERW